MLYHDPDRARFAAQVRYLAARYSLVPLGALVEALDSGRWEELPDRPLVICFDDGRAGNHALLPELAGLAAPPTLYVCAAIDAAERPPGWLGLSPAQVRELAAQCEIGSHTRTHPTLPDCEEEQAEAEIHRSRVELEALVRRPCLDFAYPLGAYGEREVELVRAAGYRSARTVDIGWNGPRSGRFRLRLLSIDPPTTTRLAAELSGFKWLSRIFARKGGLDGCRRHR